MLCTRFEHAPLITPASSPSIGKNINGPTLLRVPDFVEKPLGKYYLYFAHHSGSSIRLAYADSPAGPFTVYEPGALQLADVQRPNGFFGHIASPDIYVEETEQRIYLFFHGLYPSAFGQRTGVAVSQDGVHFTLVRPDEIGSFYLRVFPWDGRYYGISKNGNTSGLFSVSDTLTGVQRTLGEIIPNMRHCAVWLEGDQLYLFYTVVGDAPERILATRLTLTPGLDTPPQAGKSFVVAEPETDEEGLQFENKPSKFGYENDVRQLRDPFIYEENGRFYLYFSYAGENGISGGELDMDAIRAALI